MPAINFQAQWADAVEYGALLANSAVGEAVSFAKSVTDGLLLPKRTTIRRPGRARPGQTLYLFTGQRTAQCRSLGRALCLAVTTVYVVDDSIRLNSQWLTFEETATLARLDTAGLWEASELIDFLKKSYDLPFRGELICW